MDISLYITDPSSSPLENASVDRFLALKLLEVGEAVVVSDLHHLARLCDRFRRTDAPQHNFQQQDDDPPPPMSSLVMASPPWQELDLDAFLPFSVTSSTTSDVDVDHHLQNILGDQSFLVKGASLALLKRPP
jgi:hypothetical protein